MATSPLGEYFRGHVGIVHDGTHANLKSIALALTELLAFNSQILQGHVTMATPPLPSFDIQGLAAAKLRFSPWKYSRKGDVAMVIWPVNFRALNGNSYKMAKDTNFKFGTHAPRQSIM